DGAYGDQCEKCGTSLNPTDLINPKSTLSGNTPILKETKHWYLPLDKYQPWLEKWLIDGKKNVLKSNVFGQCQSWLKSGLQPRSMTRDLDWGVDVPLEEAEGKKLYVWLDAPIGYISATKQWAIDEGKDWELYWKKQDNTADESTLIHFIGKDNIVFHCIIFPAILHAHGEYILPENVPANEFLNLEGDKDRKSTRLNSSHVKISHVHPHSLPTRRSSDLIDERKDWELYWKKQDNTADESTLIHFIGKDNIVFHCIIFPAILHAHGEYILPENVPANEFLNLEGDKLSTSRNHAVWLHEYLQEFPGKQDELRYMLTSILPETSDSEFTWKDFQARVNNELVAIFGNFVNRVMVLSHKYFD